MESRADLHVHSKYSDRPSEWFLRRIGAPESYVEPETIYRKCKARGLDFVTITDHNQIAGALEIAHLPDTFISSEITTYFPEDGCKLHCLVYGITEGDFADIQGVRENVYELRDLLFERRIPHSIAHPLYPLNQRLTIDHVEKLLVLFNRFEGLNGVQRKRANRIVRDLAHSMTREKMEELSARHGIEPRGERPWIKSLSGGSDDHSGIYAGIAWTSTPRAENVREFLQHLRERTYEPDGQSGGCLRFAHSIYHIAYQYYKSQLFDSSRPEARLLGGLLKRLVKTPEGDSRGLKERIMGAISRIVFSVKKNRATGVEREMLEQFQNLVEPKSRGQEDAIPSIGRDRKTFETACHISQKFACLFLRKCLTHGREGEIMECLQTLAALGPVAVGITPYMAAFHSLHRGELVEKSITDRFGLSFHPDSPAPRRAHMIEQAGPDAFTQGRFAPDAPSGTTVISCIEGAGEGQKPVVNFEPVGGFDLPGRRGYRVGFPPFLEIIEFVEKRQFSELVLTAPGPMGLTGLIAARLLGIRAVGVYRENLPDRIRELTGDEALEHIARQYVAWFYGQMDLVLVSRDGIREDLYRSGFEPGKIRLMGSGRGRKEKERGLAEVAG